MYGAVCALCGMRDKRVLTLDHIKGNGAEERREHKNNCHRIAISEYRPDLYRTLCCNCQRIAWYELHGRAEPEF